MAEIVAFSGIYYNSEKNSGRISELLCPNLNLLDEEEIKRLRENNNNIINGILPDNTENLKFQGAVHKIYGWLLRDVFLIDKAPSFYIREQRVIIGGIEYSRFGITGLIRVEEYGKNVKRCEKMVNKEVEKQFLLLKETQFNLEPIVCLYKDSSDEIIQKIKSHIDKEKVLFEYKDYNGYKNIIYKMDNKEFFKELESMFVDKPLYVIEGQDAYEAGVKYRNEMKKSKGDKYTGKEAFNYVRVELFNAFDRYLKLLPVNRVIKSLRKNPVDLIKSLTQKFKVAALNISDSNTEKLARKKIRKLLDDNLAKGILSYGLYFKAIPNKYFLLSSNYSEGLELSDVEFLEKNILRPIFLMNDADIENEIRYAFSDNKAYNYIKEKDYSVAFILNGFNIYKLLDYCDRGNLLPVYSTLLSPYTMKGVISYSHRYSKIST